MEYYLCVLDFEASCWEERDAGVTEIIEFPSVLYRVDEANKVIEFVSEFAEYVKPTIHPKLSQFCTELTGIKQEQVDKADTLVTVYHRHKRWIADNVPKDKEFVIATCGHWDLGKHLPYELKIKKISKASAHYDAYINVKDEFKYFYNHECKGMKDMLRHLNIRLEGRHHSGIDDSRNIAKVMIKMIQDGHKYDDFYFNTV